MNSSTTYPLTLSETPSGKSRRSMPFELGFFALLVILANVPLFWGETFSALTYQASAVQQGEWWRILTHPFVHLSWYHLLFDGSAFFILYSSLEEKSALKRLLYVLAAGSGSLLTALWSAPIVHSIGLCGLSGIAHGLLAISAVEMLGSTDKVVFRAGAISFLILVGKSIFEAATGNLAFSFIHIGNIGTPVAICHTGGTLGALIFWMVLNKTRRLGEEDHCSRTVEG